MQQQAAVLQVPAAQAPIIVLQVPAAVQTKAVRQAVPQTAVEHPVVLS